MDGTFAKDTSCSFSLALSFFTLFHSIKTAPTIIKADKAIQTIKHRRKAELYALNTPLTAAAPYVSVLPDGEENGAAKRLRKDYDRRADSHVAALKNGLHGG
ncbi:hypothetical protein E8E14_007718 [Neopestalotiopsis sp. 37M]|nr:hypothetical protein E8E14_007718 [Neopestalotiopsis sp. 37M]